MLHRHLVPVHHLALEITVDFVEIEPVAARNEALGLEYVRAEFVDVACGTRIVACALDSAGKCSSLNFKAFHVISLPAVHTEVEVLKLGEDLFCVDADGGISFFCKLVSLIDCCVFHCYSVLLKFF